jgi:hypothetical protein
MNRPYIGWKTLLALVVNVFILLALFARWVPGPWDLAVIAYWVLGTVTNLTLVAWYGSQKCPGPAWVYFVPGVALPVLLYQGWKEHQAGRQRSRFK